MRLLALLALCSACADGPLFTTPNYGVDVHIGNNVDGSTDAWPSPYDVDRAIELMLQEADRLNEWEYRRKATERAIRDDPPTLQIKPVAFECSASPEQKCAGTYYWANNKIIVESGRCFARSAFVHELIHWMQQTVGGQYPDYNHVTPGHWGAGIEGAASWRHIDEACD